MDTMKTSPDLAKKTDLELEEQVSRYLDMIDSGADIRALEQAEKEIARKLQDTFKQTGELPDFLKAARQKTDRLEIRLPTDKAPVQDKRDEKKKIDQKESKKSSLDQKAAGKRTEEMMARLSKFERLILARFEEGKPLAKEFAEGKPSFINKSTMDWKSFFARFKNRTEARKISTNDIQELIFRGFVSKGEKGLVISDLLQASGRIEKFIRFQVMAKVMATLAKLNPGDPIPKQLLAELAKDELVYLALAARGERTYKASAKEAEGKFFMGGAVEERAAHDLGIPLNAHLQEKARLIKKKKQGFFGSLFEKDEEFEQGQRFVPWWQWGNLSKPRKWMMARIIFYAALLAMALIGIGVITFRLIRG